jgi:hypothetical protein
MTGREVAMLGTSGPEVKCISCGTTNPKAFENVDDQRCVRCQEAHDEEVRDIETQEEAPDDSE